MIDAYRITDLRAALDKLDADGVDFVSPVPLGRNLGLADFSQSPIPFVAIASIDAPVHPDNEPG